jgi:hypothetical protein
MDSLRIRWGSDVIDISDAFALKSIARASLNFDEGKSSALPFELVPGLFTQEAHSSQPFSRRAQVPVQFCDTTHRLLHDLMGLEFPAALRLKSRSGVLEDVLAVRAWLRQIPAHGGKDSMQLVLDGYLLSPSHELGHHYQAALTDDVEEISLRDIGGSFNRIRPRVSGGWRAVSREVLWPLSAAEQEKANLPRVYKKSELLFSSIAPKLLHQALAIFHARGTGSSRDLSIALGVPEKQAASFWKGLISDGILQRDSAGNWVLNERSQYDIEKRRPPRLKRKEAAAIVEQLVKNAKTINELPEGESSLFITGLEVLGSYLDINQDDFEYLYVAWRADMRRSSKWPYIPDLADPQTGFDAIRSKLMPADKRLRLLDEVEISSVDCPKLSFFNFKAPTISPENVATAKATANSR